MRNTHERADFVMFMVGFLPSEGLFGWRRKNRKETSLFDCGIWNGDLELKGQTGELVLHGREWYFSLGLALAMGRYLRRNLNHWMMYLGCLNGMLIGFAGRASFVTLASEQASVPDLWGYTPCISGSEIRNTLLPPRVCEPCRVVRVMGSDVS